MFMPLFWVHTTSNDPSSNGRSSAPPTRCCTRSARPTFPVSTCATSTYDGVRSRAVTVQPKRRQHACGASQTAAHIEHPRWARERGTIRQAGQLGEPEGDGLPTSVELVGDGQLVDIEAVEIETCCGKRVEHGLHQVGALPVRLAALGHPASVVAGS